MKRNPRNVDDSSNKIEMDEFHRVIKSKGVRTATDKKKIRDIERLLMREGLPEAIRDKKTADLRDLKKGQKSKNEAEKFEERYKKVKFIEKRKVIRKLEKFEKSMDSQCDDEDLKKKKEDWQNKLIYINVSHTYLHFYHPPFLIHIAIPSQLEVHFSVRQIWRCRERQSLKRIERQTHD